MKTKIKVLPIAFALIQSLNFHVTIALGQVTAFTYQGRLNDNAGPANGHYDFQFVLFNQSQLGNPVGPTLTNANVTVTDGLFTTILDYGSGIFTGTNYWLEISVRTNGNGAFTGLGPRQAITPTPYAITAGSVANGGLPAVYTNVVNFNNTNNNFSGSFTGNGSGLTGVWKIGGNAGTANDFIGTTDDSTFEIRVNNIRAMRYELITDVGGTWTNAPNITGGSSVNFVSSAAVGGTIGGGGGNDSPAGGFASANKVTGDFGTVGGGLANIAYYQGTVSGGGENTAGGLYATVTGGYLNSASGNYSAINGGDQNNATGLNATVGGGHNNTAGGADATVGGGYHNTAGGDYATIGGGWQNIANGDYSFAGGYYAHANHNGSFVWSDSVSASPFSSTMANQFRVRATGGAAFVTAIDVNGNVTAGVHVLNGDTAWSSISDKNAKKNFQAIDGEAVLEKLAAIPVERWNYKWEADTDTPHMGPMAQDFKAAFYPGRDDKSISTLEFDGVELAAIQGLNQKLKEKDAEIRQLRQSVLELKQMVSQLAEKNPNSK